MREKKGSRGAVQMETNSFLSENAYTSHHWTRTYKKKGAERKRIMGFVGREQALDRTINRSKGDLEGSE